MTQLSSRVPAELFNFDPKDHVGLQVQTEIFTVSNQGKWRQYDGQVLTSPSLAFSQILALSLRTNHKNDTFLRLDLAAGSRAYSIENRCSPNDRGMLPTRSHSLMEALLGLNALNGTLCDCRGYFTASVGNRPGPSGNPGIFINVTDMTTGVPLRVPKKLLDRDLSTGEFYTSVEMLKEAIKPY